MRSILGIFAGLLVATAATAGIAAPAEGATWVAIYKFTYPSRNICLVEKQEWIYDGWAILTNCAPVTGGYLLKVGNAV